MGVSLWIMKRNVPRLGSKVRHRARWVKREVPKGFKFKKAKYYRQKEKKIVA